MTEEVVILLKSIIDNSLLLDAVFSSPLNKETAKKVTIRPVTVKGRGLFQVTEHYSQKVFHTNMTPQECGTFIMDRLLKEYKQGTLFTEEKDFHLLTNKKGVITLLKKAPTKKRTEELHNRQKNYALSEGKPIPFMIELGLMNGAGKIVPQKYDKFRQINKFLEVVQDVLSQFEEGKEIRIVDFGCGKAYLTFALYYYLREVKGMDISLTGVDLKEDVIAYCQGVAEKLGYTRLHFCLGDIAGYQSSGEVDMVVALHACNTATDEAIAQALRWGAKIILTAPCCQHELYGQIASPVLDSLLRHGILKERLAALATDAARADILEMMGYSAQIIEFIDSEHTPKNLMIRAVKGLSKQKQEQAHSRYQTFAHALNIAPALYRLIQEFYCK